MVNLGTGLGNTGNTCEVGCGGVVDILYIEIYIYIEIAIHLPCVWSTEQAELAC